jgi:hypothetical protein
VCLLALSFTSASGQAQDWQSSVQTKLLTEFKLTNTADNGSSIAKEGTAIALKKGGLVLYTTQHGRAYISDNVYKDGVFKAAGVYGDARGLSEGDRLWLTGIAFPKKGNEIVLTILSEPVDGRRYWGTLKFVFPKESLPSADQFAAIVGEYFEDANASGSTTLSAADSTSNVQVLPGETSKLDVAGVRLGMTPDEAMDALRKFANWPVLKKRYEDTRARGSLSAAANLDQSWNITKSTYTTFGFLGYSNDCVERKNIKDRLLVAIVAAKANRTIYPPNTNDITRNNAGHMLALNRHADLKKPFTPEELQYVAECDWTGDLMVSRPGEDPLEVAVYFSPTPGKEHVIAVSLWSSLANSPLVETLAASALRKYGPEYSALRESSSGDGAAKTFSWRFGQEGKLYPEASEGKSNFERANPDFNGFGMRMFSPRNGVGLDFNIRARPDNPQLARFYSVALFNEKEIVAFGAQENAAIQEMVTKQKQEEVDKAKESGAQIKF